MNDGEKTDQEIKTTLAGVGGEKSTSQAEEGALPVHTAQLGGGGGLATSPGENHRRSGGGRN
jgi:hypothetical protein